jgi:hypothetical protein
MRPFSASATTTTARSAAFSFNGVPEGLTWDDVLDNITLFGRTNTGIPPPGSTGKTSWLLFAEGREDSGGASSPQISPDRQISWLSISFCKNIPIYRTPKSDAYSLPSRSFQGGGSRSSRYVGRDVVDVECAFDERRRPGRPSRVVLTPRGRRQAGGVFSAGDGVNKTLITGESTR